MADVPHLLLDPRSGSKDLKPYLRALGARVDDSQQIPADIAFCGYGREGIMSIGIEYKLTATGDIFSSLSDGRLTGTQLPRMLDHYLMRYVLIEGPTRCTDEGELQHSPMPGKWISVNGRPWTAHEYWSRLGSIAEFWSEPNVPGRTEVKETHNKVQSAQWIISRYQYWAKFYEEHSSYREMDHSRDRGKRSIEPGFKQGSFTATSELPIVQRMAKEIDGIGAGHSGYVARRFATPAEMILADEESWRAVECLQKLKGKDGYRKIHFSKETIRKIRRQLWGDQIVP